MEVCLSLVCKSAEKDGRTGVVNCQGVCANYLLVEQFPATINCTLVAWLKGVHAGNNCFRIIVFNLTGSVLGENPNYQCSLAETKEIAEILVNLRNIVFSSEKDTYKVELWHEDRLLLSKIISAKLSSRLVNLSSYGDKGVVRL